MKTGKRKQEKKLREGSTLSLCLKGRVGFKQVGRKGTASETVAGGMGCAWDHQEIWFLGSTEEGKGIVE